MRGMRRAIALLAALLLTAATAAGETQTTPEYFQKRPEESLMHQYRFGGSKRDWINGMAAAPDGRIAITGYTESSDGTLFDRTKDWRAGWVMMLSPERSVQWNYCSRSGDADHMRWPVFHADGSLSVVQDTEGVQLKIVGIDTAGKRTSTRTVMTDGGESTSIAACGAVGESYLLSRSTGFGEKTTYTLFGGNREATAYYDGIAAVDAVGGGHILCEREQGEVWLCTIDEQGMIEPKRCVYTRSGGQRDRVYNRLIPLDDGGAAACGRYYGSDAAHTQGGGIISRWDAQGNTVFEMILPAYADFAGVTCFGDGLVAAGYVPQGAGGKDGAWHAVYFDERGLATGSLYLAAADYVNCAPMCTLEDGSAVCALLVGEFGAEDVLLTVIDPPAEE